MRWPLWRPEQTPHESKTGPRSSGAKPRRLAIRTIIGCILTEIFTLTYVERYHMSMDISLNKNSNIVVAVALDGELTWFCYIGCNLDSMYSTLDDMEQVLY